MRYKSKCELFSENTVQSYYATVHCTVKTGKKGDFQPAEKQKIVQLLSQGQSTLDIAKCLSRDHRTVKKFVANSKSGRKKRVQSKYQKINARHLRQIRRHVTRNPLATSREVFEACKLPKVSRTTRCKALKEVAKVRKAQRRPPLNKNHKAKRISWAEKYMKIDFSRVIFTDECRATLDGPDGWARGWITQGQSAPVQLRRQQGGGGVMFWAAIVGDQMIGPFRVEDGVKLNSEGYCDLLNANFVPWWKKHPARQRKLLIFMHDNAPSHASHYTKVWMERNGFKQEQIMEWPACSPDLNPIENLWSVLKQTIYANGKQYNSKDALWDAIKEAAAHVSKETINNLTKSVDSRLLKVISKQGGYIDM